MLFCAFGTYCVELESPRAYSDWKPYVWLFEWNSMISCRSSLIVCSVVVHRIFLTFCFLRIRYVCITRPSEEMEYDNRNTWCIRMKYLFYSGHTTCICTVAYNHSPTINISLVLAHMYTTHMRVVGCYCVWVRVCVEHMDVPSSEHFVPKQLCIFNNVFHLNKFA